MKLARVDCNLCGRQVSTTAKNYIFANDTHQHKKCPNQEPKLSDEDKHARRDLTDAIQWLAVKNDKPLNWSLITAQIKRLLEEGYSHQDQLYALKWLVEKDGEFWGYGRLEKFILHAMEHKKKLEEFELKKSVVEQRKVEPKVEVKVVSKPTFFDMGDETPDWL